MSTPPRNSERLEKVLQVSGQLFARQGYHATSTREIARMADVSENTLFRQFETKEQIFWAALRHRCNHLRLRRELLEGITNSHSPEVVLPQLLEQLVDTAYLNPDTLRLMAVAFLEFRWEAGNVCADFLVPILLHGEGIPGEEHRNRRPAQRRSLCSPRRWGSASSLIPKSRALWTALPATGKTGAQWKPSRDSGGILPQENIPIVPLYFSKPRPCVRRNGQLLMIDDDRFPLQPGEQPEMLSVRFRTLGCYPLTAAVESTATTLEEIVNETLAARTSERHGRLIDHDQAASMEKKKQEGYF